MNPSIAFYVSGHGFGHASRQIEVINALGVLRPDLTIVVRTSAPAWLFERTVTVPFVWIPGECDTGAVQIDSIRLDEAATIARADEFYRTLPERAAAEAAILETRRARFVVADAPPLGCTAAHLAGLPSVVLTNFTWDWIYEGYAEQLAMAPELLPTVQAAYRLAREAWRLPMHGGFDTFERIIDVPFIARHATQERVAVRRRLGLPLDRPLVLSSFGGYGVAGFDVRALDCLDTWGIVLTPSEASPAGSLPAGVYEANIDGLYGSGLRYEDLVAACDVVATKPGYGILAECIANQTGVLYTSRGRFVEYEVLVDEMPRYLRSSFIPHDDLFAGRWKASLDRILASPAPLERPATNGADVIAEMISDAARP